jgi:periplasmic protein TonB
MNARAADTVVWETLSVPRIAAVSATLSIHVVAFALLMMPVSMPDRPYLPETITSVDFLDPPKPEVKPETIALKPLAPSTPLAPQTKPRSSDSQHIDETVISGEASTETATALDTQVSGTTDGDTAVDDVAGGDVDASTRAQFPIQYPVSALRAMAMGVVWVKVRYDATGTVTEARIHQSSRHRDLDRAALAGVRKWKINPRQVQGQPVGGESLVEVVFNL